MYPSSYLFSHLELSVIIHGKYCLRGKKALCGELQSPSEHRTKLMTLRSTSLHSEGSPVLILDYCLKGTTEGAGTVGNFNPTSSLPWRQSDLRVHYGCFTIPLLVQELRFCHSKSFGTSKLPLRFL